MEKKKSATALTVIPAMALADLFAMMPRPRPRANGREWDAKWVLDLASEFETVDADVVEREDDGALVIVH
jgi:hypothetical protein